MKTWLGRIDWTKNSDRSLPIEWAFVAVLLTTLAVFHSIVLVRSGALWRDEVSLVNTATAPWGQIAERLPYDWVPMGCVMLLRGWSDLLGSSEMSLRVFGMAGGAAIVAAIFYAGRSLGIRVPLVALVMCAANPITVYGADAVRHYGFGTAMILVAMARNWKLATVASRRNFLLAAGANVLAVQFLYQGAVFVGAFCLAGALVGLSRRNRRGAGMAIAAGMPAAISLAYLPIMARHVGEAAKIMRSDVSLGDLLDILYDTLRQQGAVIQNFWLVIAGLALMAGIAQIFGQSLRRETSSGAGRNRAMFCITTAIIGTAGFFAFLQQVHVGAKMVYFVTLMAVVGVCMDGMLERIVRVRAARVIWFAIATVCLAMTIRPLWAQSHVRRTNIDLVTAELMRQSQNGDAIVVLPWHLGVSFAYYYHGDVPFIVVPHITDFSTFRGDQMIGQMMETDPLKEVRQRIYAALADGHVVWVIGDLKIPPANNYPPPIIPAPDPEHGYSHAWYSYVYSLQVGQYLKDTAKVASHISLLPSSDMTLDQMESVPLTKITGLKQRAASSRSAAGSKS